MLCRIVEDWVVPLVLFTVVIERERESTQKSVYAYWEEEEEEERK